MPEGIPRLDEETQAGSIRPLDGFPSLANFIASDHDRSSLTFRRFDELSARNLLYLQSELSGLQFQLAKYDAEDSSFEHGDLQSRKCAMNWEAFKDAARVPGSKQEKRMKLVMEIRRLMKEYSKDVLR